MVANLINLLEQFSKILFEKTSNRLYLRSVNIITPKHWKNPNPAQSEAVYFKGRSNGVNMENTPIRVYHGEDNTVPPPRTIKGKCHIFDF